MTQPPRDLDAVVAEMIGDDPTDVDTLRQSTQSYEQIAQLLSDELRKAQG